MFHNFSSTGPLHAEVGEGPVDIDEDDEPSLTFSPSVLIQIDEGPIFAGTEGFSISETIPTVTVGKPSDAPTSLGSATNAESQSAETSTPITHNSVRSKNKFKTKAVNSLSSVDSIGKEMLAVQMEIKVSIQKLTEIMQQLVVAVNLVADNLKK